MEILGISHYFWSGVGLVIAIILSIWGRRLNKILDHVLLDGSEQSWARLGYGFVWLSSIVCLILIYFEIFLSKKEPMADQMFKTIEFIAAMYIIWGLFLFLSFILFLISQKTEIRELKIS